MEKAKNIIKRKNIYLIYTILFSTISFIIFYIFIKYNKGFIWQDDGFKQHFTILYDFNQIIRNIFQDGFPMLSWNMGLGLDTIGQYSYYIIGDPFAYLSLLFPISHLETVYSFLVILRMYCVGLSFIAFCKYMNKSKTNTIIGAIIYTFCGFIIYAGIRHPYFTNAAIFFPLTLIGIEKLLKENKKTFLILTVFLSAISNYYFFYMILIVDFIYAIIKYIVEYNKGIKEFFYKFLNAVLCYIVGILMASIILFPTIYAFLNSARTSFEQVYQYDANFYKYLFMGIISMRFTNWTVISISSIILLMLPVLFTNWKQKESKSFAILWIIISIMLLFPFISSLMNGFSYFNNRWVFCYSFILSYIVTLSFKSKYTKKQLVAMILTLAIYILIGIAITKFKVIKNLDFYGAMVIAVCILMIFVFNYYRENKKDLKVFKYTNILILILVILNIGGISLALYSPIGKRYVEEFLDNNTVKYRYSNLNGKIENFEKAILYIKNHDNSLYRIAKNDTNNQNASLFYDYNSLQTFLSIGNGDVYNLSCGIEDNCFRKTQCVNGMDRRTKITTLLGEKYFICEEKDASCVPYGYKLYHKIGKTQIYINKNYLPIGVIYNKIMLEEDYDKLEPLEKEDTLIKSAVVENEIPNIQNINKNNQKIKKLSYNIKDKEILENKLITNRKDESISLNVNNLKKDTEIYLSIKNLKYNSGKEGFKITTKFQGTKGKEELLDFYSSPYYIDNKNFLINLGVVRKNSDNKVKINFKNVGTYTWDNIEIIEVPMKDYEEDIKKLQENKIQEIKYGNNWIGVSSNCNTKGILQISTSYSKGWKVYIDGKENKVIKVNKGLIGAVVDEGKHEIIFKYETPYLNIGAICSLIGIIIFTCILVVEKKKNKS